MTDVPLILALVGVIATGAVVLYVLVGKEPTSHADRRPPRTAEPTAGARARARR